MIATGLALKAYSTIKKEGSIYYIYEGSENVSCCEPRVGKLYTIEPLKIFEELESNLFSLVYL